MESRQVCSVCQSASFAHDELSGYMVCATCGTELTEFMPISNDDEDNAVINSESQRGIRSSNLRNTTLLNSRNDPKQSSTFASLKSSLTEKDVINLLVILQAALKVLANAVAIKADIDPDSSKYALFMEYIQKIWFDYIRKWDELTSASKMSITDPKALFCTVVLRLIAREPNIPVEYDHSIHPNYPSKYVLLAIIYLALRQLKSWVIIADLVRWVEHDDIPYHNVYSKLSSAVLRSHQLHALHEWIFKSKATTITPSIILYYTTTISKRLNIALPTLNAPLIAASIISKLGLPPIILNIFRQVIAAPSLVLRTHYPEDIVAVIIIAMKLHLHLPFYSYQREEAADAATPLIIPASVRDIDNFVTRSNLFGYVDMMRSRLIDPVQLDDSKLIFPVTKTYNKVITAANPSANNPSALSRRDDSVPPNKHVVIAQKPSYCRAPDKYKLKVSSARHRHLFLQTIQGKRSTRTNYYIYGDSVDEQVPAAYRVLLERLSRYLYSSPALLQRHVSCIEKQVALVNPYQCGTVIPVPNDMTNAAQVHTHKDELTIKPSMNTALKLAAEKAKSAENHNAVEVVAPAEASAEYEGLEDTLEEVVERAHNRPAPIKAPKARSQQVEEPRVRQPTKVTPRLSRATVSDVQNPAEKAKSAENHNAVEVVAPAEASAEYEGLEDTLEEAVERAHNRPAPIKAPRARSQQVEEPRVRQPTKVTPRLSRATVSDVQNPAKRARIEEVKVEVKLKKIKVANSHISREAVQGRGRGRRW